MAKSKTKISELEAAAMQAMCATTRNCSWTKAISNEAMAVARAFERALEGLPEGEREAKKAKMVEYVEKERQVLAISSVTSTQSAVLAASKRPQARDQALNPSPRFWSEKDSQFVKPTRTITIANVTSWKSTQFRTAFFLAFQETHLPETEQMATAQRWSRKRGWAAAFQGAEVVGEHHAANRGCVAIAGPLHISTSVPAEFESCWERRRSSHQKQCKGCHNLAKNTRSVTLVTVHIKPGLRASGVILWLLVVLAPCILCFDGPWIAMGDWNVEPKDLAQADWLGTVNGKVFAPSATTCAGGAGAIIDYFLLSEAMEHLVQNNFPTTPHLPVNLSQSCHGVKGYWLADGQKCSTRRCQWDRNARRNFLIGPGQQRISLSTWSWRGWSGCAQKEQHGARFTTFAGPNASLLCRKAKSSFFWPGHAQRHEETLATWRKG